MTNHNRIDSFEDRSRGVNTSNHVHTAPWIDYTYGLKSIADFKSAGIGLDARDGYQSAFLMVSNAVGAADASGFGYTYVFPGEWPLPIDRAQWRHYTVACDFRQTASRACQIELQVKSATNRWIEFTKTYTPGPDGWDTVAANLCDFSQPAGGGTFDPQHVQALAVNVRMLQTGVLYHGVIDRTRFHTPNTWLAPETRYGLYTTAGVPPRSDTDGDGLLDACETGTGVFRDETDTGTRSTWRRANSSGVGYSLFNSLRITCW